MQTKDGTKGKTWIEPSANLFRVTAQIDNRGVQFLWRMLSLRFAVVGR